MAQPVFLKNFTLDGFDMGELFVTANVTIPFLNVERGYYTVGNSDGQNLQNTRLNATQITIDGFLIRDFSDLTISETKDQLVAQLMSRRTQRLVFDALPDRYFNVVFEGSQDYDATDDALTPLTLTFTCPDGVAHSITPDVFRNVASTSANWIVDSEFETSTFWNNDSYVTDFKKNGSSVIGLDYSDQEIEEMDSVVNDFFADNVFFEDETMGKGNQWVFSYDYAVLKKNSEDLTNDGSLSVVIDELDKINGKVLSTVEYPMPYGTVEGGGEVSTAYAFDATGKDRFSFEDNTTPNMYPYGTSEAPIPSAYLGSVVTIDGNQTVPEWGATTARRVKITGGTSIVKGTFTTGLLTVGGVTYTASIYAKNNGTTPVTINSNFAGFTTLQPNESRRISYTASRPIGTTNVAIQWIIQVPDVSQSIDVTLWRAKTSANTELDVWTEANQGTTDNTTPTYVGYSTTDIASAPSNLLLNGSLKGSLNSWSVNGLTYDLDSGYTRLKKSAVTTALTYLADSQRLVGLPSALAPTETGTLSAEIFIEGGFSGTFVNTQLALYVSYTDNSTQYVRAKVDESKIDVWQRLSLTATLANKQVSNIQVLFYIGETFVGNIRIKNMMLSKGEEVYPFTRHITERGLDYTWYAYGTGFDASTVPFTRRAITYIVRDEQTKVLRVSVNVLGNSHVLMYRPFFGRTSGTYVASAKEYLQAIPFTNYGTWKSYPTFKINNRTDNGLIGIINENGQVLQFGNEENVDATEPISDVYGLNESYRASTRPSNSVINAGHVSNYPYAGNNPETPNLYRGSYDFAPTEVTKPIMPNIGDTNSWVGPSLTTTIAAPPSGLRTGAYRYQEVIVFDTDADKRGRMELVVISEANDIVMGLTIRDSDATGNEIILEHWFGNKLLKTVKTDVSKFKNSTFRVTMERDSTGKKFNWNFENVQYVKNEPYKVVSKNPFNYNATIANKAPVAKVSRWLMKWREGRSTREVIDKQTWSFRTNNALNIRNSSTTNSKILGTMAKGVTFDSTKMQRGQTVVKDNRWFYVSKNTSKGIPASGWVSAYHLTQNKYVETKRKETFDSFTKMEIAGSQFLWVGTGKAKEAKNPFKAGDNVVLNTYDKTIFVNGVEREDLATIGNMWEGFTFEPGEHYLRFVNSDWSSNTLEVSVINNRTYL